MRYSVNETVGNFTAMLTLNKPSPCCLNVYVESKNKTATGKLYAHIF